MAAITSTMPETDDVLVSVEEYTASVRYSASARSITSGESATAG